MRKSIMKLSVALLMSITLISLSTSSKAEEVMNGDSAGDRDSYVLSEQEQINEALEEAETGQQVEGLKAKLAVVNGRLPRATYKAATISCPYYKQETGYYCGPATTKQTIQYMTGSSSSQKTIASALGTTTNGTDGTRIVKYLNQKQKKLTWTIASDISTNGLKTRISSSITGSTKRPPIMRCKFNKGGNWSYTTAGHFMNISGYTKDMATVWITDPNIGRVVSNHSGSYYVKFTEMRTSIVNHWAQHLYW